ncbi:MAG: DUF6934 family protein [Spirosomataceae bacterium]
MDKPFYDFKILDEAFRFDFISSSNIREIPKTILYQKTTIANFYNLVLADIQPDGSLDVFSESNNGDMEMILATVVQTMLVFTAYYPKASIVFTGSTPSRTRLYQIVLSKEIDKSKATFEILGLKDDKLSPFEKNQTYEGFVISKKIP